MIVISDTTPIISLMKVKQLELLQKLFDIVYIPDAVYRELVKNEAYQDETRIVQECDFLLIEKVENEKSVAILRNVVSNIEKTYNMIFLNICKIN